MAFNTQMEYRYLGRSGLKVSVCESQLFSVANAFSLGFPRLSEPEVTSQLVSLGGWVTYGLQVGEDAVEQCLVEAYNNGINFFDNTESGKERTSFFSTKAAIERLQLDDVDCEYWEFYKSCLLNKEIRVFTHRPDPDTPLDEVVRSFNWLISQGLGLYWGTSEWSAEQLTDAWRLDDRMGLVGQYKMFHRERFEAEDLAHGALGGTHGLGTTIWRPLASGVFLLAFRNQRIAAGLDTLEGKDRLAKVEKLKPIAERLGASLAHIALAWTIKNPNVSTVITGESTPSQVTENGKALAVVPELTATPTTHAPPLGMSVVAKPSYGGADFGTALLYLQKEGLELCSTKEYVKVAKRYESEMALLSERALVLHTPEGVSDDGMIPISRHAVNQQ
ncbi:NADP-dependent oxidoreductase domain-containing protein [Chytriomyces sp. MP71]|nr:NADP-dependent oxidoreductase domain-containing protein [Chytriomyces sp. MP71]